MCSHYVHACATQQLKGAFVGPAHDDPALAKTSAPLQCVCLCDMSAQIAKNTRAFSANQQNTKHSPNWKYTQRNLVQERLDQKMEYFHTGQTRTAAPSRKKRADFQFNKFNSWSVGRGLSFPRKPINTFASVYLSFYTNCVGAVQQLTGVSRLTFFLITWHTSIIVMYWRSWGGDRTGRDVLCLN